MEISKENIVAVALMSKKPVFIKYPDKGFIIFQGDVVDIMCNLIQKKNILPMSSFVKLCFWLW